MNWTDEQQEVIDTRQKNILVSAAAGSGKTAVLTERILQLITSEENPIHVDELVVVTFTRAAAGEMRERIFQALQKKAEEYLELIAREIDTSENEKRYEWMQTQLSLLHTAKITTIDSFCLDVVREHFAMLDLDPAFKVAEEGELVLLKADVMEKVLEQYYTEPSEEFLAFVDVYSSNRDDAKIEELITTLYQFAMSYPNPKEWIDSCANHYLMSSDDFEQTDWYRVLEAQIRQRLSEVLIQIEDAIAVAQEPDGPQPYVEALEADKKEIQELLNEKDYNKRVELFQADWTALKRISTKSTNISKEKQTLVQDIRKAYKSVVDEIGDKYYGKAKDKVIEDIKNAYNNAQILKTLVLNFMEEFAAAKREKNLVDFHDLEHFALEILTEKKDNELVPSEVAKDMAKNIAEIMIDEYQDSNDVQEQILKSVSGHGKNESNVFMVGDVKQSSYKFRMAKPELFLEKYNTFQRKEEGDSTNRKIILSKNFRSRKRILDATNTIFKKIMTKEVGGIVYDDANALHYGANYAGEDEVVEILLLNTHEESAENLKNDVNVKELEAEMIALRIQELVEKEGVAYSDIVILMRSISGPAELYERVFKAHQIPVKCPIKKGCFDAFEVRIILQFLTIIDNPRQDIPLTAVLLHMFHFTEEELARIKVAVHGKMLYDNVRSIYYERTKKDKESKTDADVVPSDEQIQELTERESSAEEQDKIEELSETIKEKVYQFFELLEKYRKMQTYYSVYDLIQMILKDTGFEYFVAALPSGTMRLKNLQMFKERAAIYQQSSYSGLFHFIRYIEKNQEYEIEEETIANADVESAVTIMSIHKSKGLEFPIVFVASMNKKFNQMDAQAPIVLHSTYGMGLNSYCIAESTKTNTLLKRSISAQIVLENIAEEARVLYVAMTRAKERLFLCGSIDLKSGTVKKYQKYYEDLKKLSIDSFMMNDIISAKSYLDWILMSVGMVENSAQLQETNFTMNIKKITDLAKELIEEQVAEEEYKQQLKDWKNQQTKEDIQTMIEEMFAFQYPYQSDVNLKAKVSVSDIKHQMMKMYDDEPEMSDDLDNHKQFMKKDAIVPKFMQNEEEKLSAAERGTAYHRVFELLDYSKLDKASDIETQLADWEGKNLISKEIRQAISSDTVWNFVQSPIGQRMKKVALRGELFREQQFVMKLPAQFVDENYQGEETVLIQGIVDAWFEENGEICIVDYKTDNIRKIEELEDRYRIQLISYGNAVQRITGKKVKELILYSVKKNSEYSMKDTRGLEDISDII